MESDGLEISMDFPFGMMLGIEKIPAEMLGCKWGFVLALLIVRFSVVKH